MRLFVAVPLPPDVTAALGDVLPDLPALRTVRPEAMHVTLAFLGDVPEARLPSAADAVAEAGVGRSSFTAVLDRLGRFPERGAPRTIWVGVGDGATPLGELAAALRDALTAARLPFDAKPFQAHVTLARVRERADRTEVHAVGDALARARVAALRFTVDGFLLLQSDLSRTGARYTPRAAVQLGVPG